jgi:hypothetical protein
VISTSFTNKNRKQLKIYGIIGALLTLIIPFLLTFQNEHNHLDEAQSLCPFKMLTGFPCPGCGITKSLVYIYEGDLSRSLHFHLFGPFVFALCLAAILILSVELFTGKSYFRSLFYSKKVAYFLATILVVYHVIRLFYFVSDNTFDDILRQSIWK